MSNGHEFDELTELLRSWNVSDLLTHLKDEGINIEELQMIKRHHLAEVLRNFKYGTRIRFEHHLEHWRRWLNMPLQDSPVLSHCGGCSCTHQSLHQHQVVNQNQDVRATEQQQQQPCADLLDDKTNALMIPEPFVALNEMDTLPLALNDQIDLGQPQQVEDKAPSEIIDCDAVDGEISVLSILQASGVKGQSLLELRGQNVELQLEQRLLLIQLICNYYGGNQLHMTLQRSHLLESEILDLFPKEKLSYYRKNRRGKIYVKYTYMKRFKRDAKRRKKLITRQETCSRPWPFTGICYPNLDPSGLSKGLIMDQLE